MENDWSVKEKLLIIKWPFKVEIVKRIKDVPIKIWLIIISVHIKKPNNVDWLIKFGLNLSNNF